MIVYEKNNKLNINFDNEVSENPDLQIGKEDGKTQILVDGQPSGGGGNGIMVSFTEVPSADVPANVQQKIIEYLNPQYGIESYYSADITGEQLRGAFSSLNNVWYQDDFGASLVHSFYYDTENDLYSINGQSTPWFLIDDVVWLAIEIYN